jgi:ParB-like chromosome segregation protein Spo0J
MPGGALPAVTATPVTATASQPVSAVRWVPRHRLTANSWNPNHAAPPERRLLRTSILENGWTSAIVVHRFGADADGPLFQIIDGYHRWLTSADPDVAALTGGLVPIVELVEPDPALARMATIRHNRARGVHHVTGMADIVADLLQLGLTPEEIGRRLEMDEEEVSRLADRGVMTRRGSAASFGNGWTV